jgi:ankyrin repeat protein
MGHSLVHIAAQASGRSSINLDNDTPSATFMEIAIDAGADLSSKDDWGRTPLYTAIYSRNILELKALLNANVKIDEETTKEIARLKSNPPNKENKEMISLVEKARASQRSSARMPVSCH